MAFWNPQRGWQTYNLATNARTNFSSSEFIREFPSTDENAFVNQFPDRSESSFATEFPANRPETRRFFLVLSADGKQVTAIRDDNPGGNVRAVFFEW